MNRPLEGRSALITGGGSGIGLATAKALLADGASVTICGRSKERVDAAAAELEGSASQVRAVSADVTNNADDELGAVGIRVNAVRPGLVPTDLASGLTMNERIVADYIKQMPLARLGEVDDVAAGIRYLLGPESAWVTGQCLAIDGGHTLRRGPDIAVGFRGD